MNGSIFGPTLSVAWKDVKILSKDKGTMITLFVVPLMFILAFSGLLGGGSDPEEQLITLPAVNLDAGSEGSQALIDALNEGGGLQIQLYERDEAQALLEEGEIARVLTIPANYATDVAAGSPVTHRLVSDTDASEETNQAVQSVVLGVARDLSLETQLIAGLQRMGVCS